MNGIILSKDFLSEKEIEQLNKLYKELDTVKDNRLFHFEAFGQQHSISVGQRDILLKISTIEKQAAKKALEYYAENIDELISVIETEIEYLVILEAKKESFLEIAPFIELVQTKDKAKYDKLMKFISETIDNQDELIKSKYGQLVIKKFKMAKQNSEKIPEKALLKKAIDGIMPVDKLSQRVFNPAENEKYYDPDGIEVTVGKIRNKPITAFVTINTDELPNIEISKKVTLFDRAVANALYSIRKAGNKFFTINSVYMALNGNKETLNHAKEKTKEEIERSIDKLRFTKIVIKEKDIKLEDYFIPAKKVTANINGVEVECYMFHDTPPLLDYSSAKKQINTHDIKILSTPLKTTSENIVLKNILLEQILGAINEKSKLLDVILYDTIYKKLSVEADNALKLADKRREIRKKVNEILNFWVEQKAIEGFIGFTELTERDLPPKKGEKIAKIKLIISRKIIK